MPKKISLTDYTRKSWNSLSDIRDHMLKEDKETVIKFDGSMLITEHRVIGLAYGQVSIRPLTKELKERYNV